MLSSREEQSRDRRGKSLEDAIRHPAVQNLDRRFFELAEQLEGWSQDTQKLVKDLAPRSIGPRRFELDPLRKVLGKWSIEIITILHARGLVGFTELRKGLEGISARVLSQKLKEMQRNGLVSRTVLSSTPTRVQYGLSDRGHVLVGLGRPVVLFLWRENYPKRRL